LLYKPENLLEGLFSNPKFEAAESFAGELGFEVLCPVLLQAG
jgi:hypothetical protein